MKPETRELIKRLKIADPNREWHEEEIISKDYEPNIIFLLTPTNSGSTTIAELLKTSKNVSSINDVSEAHELIKGMCRKPGRWHKDLIERNGVDRCARSIRSVWVNECYKRHKKESANYFIEKSAPNMIRIEFLQSLFPNSILLANNRDPYANVSSRFYRYTDQRSGKSIDRLTVSERKHWMLEWTKMWVDISRILKEVIEKQNVPYLSYEKFCEQPTLYQKLIDNSSFAGEIKLDFESVLKVKDYKPTSLITNYNEKQIARLTNSDIEVITSYLKDNEDVLSFFEYTLKK